MGRSPRARSFVGVVVLSLASGCVLLTGVGDLEVGSGGDGGDALATADSSIDATASDARADALDSNVADTSVADTSVADTSVVDTSVADTSVADVKPPPPDTGPPDTGRPDTGNPGPTSSVGCGGSTVCSAKACCWSALFSSGSCAPSSGTCSTGGGTLACDDATDCGSGNVCCVTWNVAAFSVSSQCTATCSASVGGIGTKTGPTCKGLNDCSGQAKCDAVSIGPPTLMACQ